MANNLIDSDAAKAIHRLRQIRRSLYSFSERPVEVEVLRSLFEAARWAPSCFNEQPWRFIVSVRESNPKHDLFLGSLIEANQRWAIRAPVLLFSIARLDFERNGERNRHALHDVGLATQNLILEATALGLITHPMAGFDAERVRSLAGIPDGYDPVTAIAVGYPGDATELPEALRARQASAKTRKTLEDLVFDARWAQPLRLATAQKA